jgi:hypothetical protein
MTRRTCAREGKTPTSKKNYGFVFTYSLSQNCLSREKRSIREMCILKKKMSKSIEKRYPKHGQSKFQLAKRFGDFLNSVIIFVA